MNTLLYNGYELEQQTQYGQTPYDIAEQAGQAEAMHWITQKRQEYQQYGEYSFPY